jgi:alanyl-tRNA synthetase
MKATDLRNKYLDFFKEKKHKVFPSDSLVPDDASLLFTSAGMNQFKPYFLGEKKNLTKAASCQKCLRTGDLERVGQTPYHHTFFEMLGNFSFGDYFKKEAIEFAWEFLCKRLNMKEGDLWVSVYKDDDEAYQIWKKYIGVPVERIVKLEEDSNFWPAAAPTLGPNGPCGPCSEIFFDRGKKVGCKKRECNPDCSCGRFVEVWNLVFTQFNRVGVNKLEPLPQKNIDTGMGLERMASVLQGKESNFGIDILAPVVKEVKEILGIKKSDKNTRSLINAIVDHGRAVTFAIADGVFPSNEDRGYVIRKIIRKALWKGTVLGKKDPFIHKLPAVCSQIMKDQYPDVYEKRENISSVVLAEEEKFLHTLREGRNQFNIIVKDLKKKKQDTVAAADCFRLYDTYGFPLELSKEIACGHNMKIDEEGFYDFMKKAQERSRKKSMFEESIFKKGEFKLKEVSRFSGYDLLTVESQIMKIIKDGKICESLDEAESGLIVLDSTPFYPESGGQLTDKGFIKTKEGKFLVEDVFRVDDAIVHKGKVIEGRMSQGLSFSSVDRARRDALMRAHTATHLLQAALRSVLGTHVMQQGSLVDVDKLRFDFTHFKGLSRQELRRVEEGVNEFIMKGDKIDQKIFSYDEAKKEGALAFFKDKYGSQVRVVSIADYSKELCGGTHLENTSGVGLFSIVSESSISSGVRRIEAVVGKQAYKVFSDIRNNQDEIKEVLRCKQEDIRSMVAKLLEDLKIEKDRIDSLEKEVIAGMADEIIKAKKGIKGVNFLVYTFSRKDYPVLLYLADILRKKVSSIFVFLVSNYDGKDIFVCSVTPDLIKKGVTGKKFVQIFKDQLSLKGGGRDNLVQGVIIHRDDRVLEKIEKCFSLFIG